MTMIKGYTRRQEPWWPFILTGGLILLAVVIVLLNYNPPKIEKSALTTTSNSTTTSTVVATIPATSTTLKKIANKAFKGEVEKIEITREEGKIYCYTRLNLDSVPQVIRHVWLDPAGKVYADIKLTIARQPADTWSYISRYDGKSGTWQVQVKKADGTVLAKQSFEVGE